MTGAYTRLLTSRVLGFGTPTMMRTEHEFANVVRAQ
jgi:hypothetical protein